MDLRKVYNSTEDAFDNADPIYKIFETYLKADDKDEFFKSLRDTESNFEDSFAFSIDEVEEFMAANDELHCILFNRWLNNIRRVSSLPVALKDKFFEDVSRASYEIKSKSLRDGIINSSRVKTAFNKIATKVKKIGSVHQIDQINAFGDSFRDADVQRVLEIINYFTNEETAKDVMHIKSNYLFTGEDRGHRNSVFLAVIPNKMDVFRFVNEYLKKCEKYDVPYDIDIPYDKYSKQIVRINSTIGNLGKNLVIMEDIAQSKPEMIERMKRPPVLCGRIHNWIGIGTFSCLGTERTTYGFTEKRGEIIYDTIEAATKKYIQRNYKKEYKFDGKTVQLRDLLKEYTLNNFTKKLKTMSDDYYDAVVRDSEPEEAEKQIKDYFGFRRTDLEKPKYQKKIAKSISLDVDRMVMENFHWSENYNSFIIPSPKLFGSGRILHVDLFDDTIKNVASKIAIKDPVFVSQTVLEIKERFQQKGIDEKSCYDEYVVDKMFELGKEQDNTSTEPIQTIDVTIERKNDSKEDKER